MPRSSSSEHRKECFWSERQRCSSLTFLTRYPVRVLCSTTAEKIWCCSTKWKCRDRRNVCQPPHCRQNKEEVQTDRVCMCVCLPLSFIQKRKRVMNSLPWACFLLDLSVFPVSLTCDDQHQKGKEKGAASCETEQQLSENSFIRVITNF